jgi:hypothetical protein
VPRFDYADADVFEVETINTTLKFTAEHVTVRLLPG